jgi:3D (Asp-Asp-Asp) domain-containing protein
VTALGISHAAVRIPRKTGHAPRAKRATPSRTVSILRDGERRSLRTRAQTILEALEDANVRVGREDEVWPPTLSPLYEGTTITVTRLEIREETVVETIPYRTKLEIARGRWQRYPIVKRPGKAGRANARYAVSYRDGKRIRRRLIARTVLEPSIPRLVQMPANRTLASRGFLSGRRVFSMIATAYDPGPLSCGPKANGRTCLGLRAGHGIVAVDPRHIPLRTRLYIEGYGYAIAGDVGSAIKGNRIDLGYKSRRAALRFGRRRVKVHVLECAGRHGDPHIPVTSCFPDGYRIPSS